MDSTLAAGLIGGLAAIAGSVVSQLLLFHFERRKLVAERQRVALEQALVFLERCKNSRVNRLADEDYYDLVRTLAALDGTMRRDIVGVYQSSIDPSQAAGQLDRASAIQERIAGLLSR